MRFIARSFVFLLALGFTAGARADTDQDFILSGTLADGGTLNGTLFVDTTTGSFELIDVTVSDGGNMYVFNNGAADEELLGSPPNSLLAYFSYYVDSSLTDISLNLVFPESNLIGYQGGALCSTSVPCEEVNSFFDAPTQDFFTTLTAAPTPEPPSLVTLLTGVAGVGLWAAFSTRLAGWRGRSA